MRELTEKDWRYIRRFRKFLSEESALSLYKNNCMEQNENDGLIILVSVIDSDYLRIGDFVTAGFSWSRTPESMDFWVDLSHKWRTIVQVEFGHD